MKMQLGNWKSKTTIAVIAAQAAIQSFQDALRISMLLTILLLLPIDR